MSFLYWLESIRCPFLDAVMQAFTCFGEELAFLLLALTIFWCVSKEEGYYLLFVGFFGTVLNQFLKLLCRIPRPWVRDPSFTIVESARSGAGGYSFPSGHTQNAVGTLGGIARWHKNRALRIVCIVLAALTAFSRMYLGVHTPLDVSVAAVTAVVLIFVIYPIVRSAAEDPKKMAVLLGVMTVVALAYVIYANFARFPADVDPDNLFEGRKNSCSLLGALLGFCVGYTLERKYIRFETKAVWWAQVLKVLGGAALLLAVKQGLKLLFAAVGFTWIGTHAIRYFFVVLLAATVVWWYFAGRLGNASANATFAVPLAGAVGGNQLAPVTAGFFLPPARALGTTAFALLVAALLASFGSGNLLGWDALARWDFAGTDVQANLGALLLQPATWCIAASWLAAAAVLSACRCRPSRILAVFGIVLAAAALVAGICAAAWLASGQHAWMPSAAAIASTVVAVAGLAIASYLEPPAPELWEAGEEFEPSEG